MPNGSVTVGAAELPAQPTAFLGRDLELAAARDRLLQTEVRLLSFTGPGGTGKTRLALAVAAEAQDEFEWGAAFVDLSALADPALLGASILQMLDVHPDVQTVGQRPEDALLLALRHRHQLLVLDNLEHLLPAAPLLAEVLAACPKLKLLVTSRIPLHLRWEHEFPVPPLALPDLARLPPPEDLARVPAVALFVRRAKAALPDFGLTADNARAVAAICVRLDGLPLALELAAPRLKLYPPEALLARLEQRLDLTGGPLDLPARQRDLRSEIQWSYDLLSPEEQSAFRGLGVFAGGFELGAAAAVWGEGADAEAQVASLLEQNMVQRQPTAQDGARFRLLETLREFALGRLRERPDEEQTVRERHALFYLALAEEDISGPMQKEGLDRLGREHDNLRGALEWLSSASKSTFALRLGAALGWFWHVRSHHAEGRVRLAALLAPPPEATTEYERARAWAVYWTVWLEDVHSNDPDIVRRLAECLDAFRRLNERKGVANVLHLQANMLEVAGHYEEARRLTEEFHLIARDIGDWVGVGLALLELGSYAVAARDYAAARRYHREALALHRRIGFRQRVARSTECLGVVDYLEGDFEAARLAFEEALAIFREITYQNGVASALAFLGRAKLGLGNLEAARSHLQESAALLRDIGDRHYLATYVLDGLALLEAREGQLERSARLAGWADAQRRAVGLVVSPAFVADTERTLGAIRRGLSADAFASAWAQGRAMTLEGAVRYALEPPAPAPPSTPSPLTERETQVLKLVAKGLGNKGIAKELGISEKTVARHLENIFAKLNVSSRAAAATLATREGLV